LPIADCQLPIAKGKPMGQSENRKLPVRPGPQIENRKSKIANRKVLRSDAAKWLRLIVPGEQRGFYKFTVGGQNKISVFPISLPATLV